MAVMRSLIFGAVMAGSLAGPVYAQKSGEPNPLQREEELKRKDGEAIDRQYKSTLDKTRKATTEPRADPWQDMRGTDASKPKR